MPGQKASSWQVLPPAMAMSTASRMSPSLTPPTSPEAGEEWRGGQRAEEGGLGFETVRFFWASPAQRKQHLPKRGAHRWQGGEAGPLDRGSRASPAGLWFLRTVRKKQGPGTPTWHPGSLQWPTEERANLQRPDPLRVQHNCW